MGLNHYRELLRASLRPGLSLAGPAPYGRLGWLTAATALGQLLALVGVLFLTGGLGPEGFGAFQVALTLQFYLQILAGGGFRVVVIREIVRTPQDEDRVATAYLILTAASGAFVGLVTLAGAALLELPVQQQTLFVLVATGNLAASINLMALFDAHHKQPRCAAITLVMELFAVIALTILSLADHLTLTTAGAVFAGKWTLTTVGQFLVYHLTVQRLSLRFSLTHVVLLWRAGWPLMGAALVGSIPLRSGVFFVGSDRGDADAAILALGVQIASVYLLFATLANRVLQPLLLGRRGSDANFLRGLALFLVLFLGGLWFLAFGGMIVIVMWVLRSDYRAAIIPGALLLLGAAVIALGDTTATYLVAWERGRTVMLARVGAALAYSAGCLILVPAFSYNGAAAMTLASAVLGTVTILLALRAGLRSRPSGSGLPEPILVRKE
jgi:O-antigen/teichoic acid export membrane protein